ENSIKDMYPHFHVDYFNRRGNNPRWIDRVSDDEPGDYEMNLYNFYNIINENVNFSYIYTSSPLFNSSFCHF
ncbi:MAG: hypothetical protein SPK11_02590, partial [Bullifex sp.]|nr:hypothetical protein [Bullifex sp.]